MNVTVWYGCEQNYIDITKMVHAKCFSSTTLTFTIPSGDCARASIFGDPLPGIVKNIKVVKPSGSTVIYNADSTIFLDCDGFPKEHSKNTQYYFTKQIHNDAQKAKICIYTGIFGGYDHFNQHVKQSIPCDFIYFYDSFSPHKVNIIGQVVSETKAIPEKLSPVLASAWIRTFPFDIDVLNDYDVCIYIDGNQQINNSDFLHDIVMPSINRNERWDLMVSMHPCLTCAYAEANASVIHKKYSNTDLKAQVKYYQEMGFPANYGLYWNGLLIYNRNSTQEREQLKAFQDLYWIEFCKYAIDATLPFHPQGQISFPYCLWKIPISVIKLQPLYFCSKYVSFHGHLK